MISTQAAQQFLQNHADGRESPKKPSGSRPIAAKRGCKAADLAQILPLSASGPLDCSPTREFLLPPPPAARSSLPLCAKSHGTRCRDPVPLTASIPADSSSRCWSTRCPSVSRSPLRYTGVSCSRRPYAQLKGSWSSMKNGKPLFHHVLYNASLAPPRDEGATGPSAKACARLAEKLGITPDAVSQAIRELLASRDDVDALASLGDSASPGGRGTRGGGLRPSANGSPWRPPPPSILAGCGSSASPTSTATPTRSPPSSRPPSAAATTSSSCAGDLCFPGPEPLETWRRLTQAGAVCVQGVGDRALATIDPATLHPRSEHERARLGRLGRGPARARGAHPGAPRPPPPDGPPPARRRRRAGPRPRLARRPDRAD